MEYKVNAPLSTVLSLKQERRFLLAYKRIIIIHLLIMFSSIFISFQIKSILMGLLIFLLVYSSLFWMFIGLPYGLQTKSKFFEMYWNWLIKGGRIGPKG